MNLDKKYRTKSEIQTSLKRLISGFLNELVNLRGDNFERVRVASQYRFGSNTNFR